MDFFRFGDRNGVCTAAEGHRNDRYGKRVLDEGQGGWNTGHERDDAPVQHTPAVRFAATLCRVVVPLLSLSGGWGEGD